jgi:hypothetical protein
VNGDRVPGARGERPDDQVPDADADADADAVRPYLSNEMFAGARACDGKDRFDAGAAPPLIDEAVAETLRSADDYAPVRPYLLTSGRVYSGSDVRVETQVQATDEALEQLRAFDTESRRIIGACVEPQSVAELAAQLSLHLGVVLVLVGDLSQRGHLALFMPDFDAATRVEMIRRVMRGLHAIC